MAFTGHFRLQVNRKGISSSIEYRKTAVRHERFLILMCKNSFLCRRLLFLFVFTEKHQLNFSTPCDCLALWWRTRNLVKALVGFAYVVLYFLQFFPFSQFFCLKDCAGIADGVHKTVPYLHYSRQL